MYGCIKKVMHKYAQMKWKYKAVLEITILKHNVF